MAYGQSSGTYDYNPFISDIVLDAYERCGIFVLENKHLFSARRSLNLLLTSSWSNKGLNLWKCQEVVFPLIEGVIQYNLTRDVVGVFDSFRRQYQMNGPQSYPVAFTTIQGSSLVTIAIPGNSSPVGSYIGVQIPVSVGGLLIYGFYKVVATPTANSVTIDASRGQSSTDPSSLAFIIPLLIGMPVPSGTTVTSVSGSDIVTVNWPGYTVTVGQLISFLTPTLVGGLTLGGTYTVISAPDPSHLTINVTFNAASSATTIVASISTDIGGATATVVNGGEVPLFTTSAGSQTVVVTLGVHGLSVGDPFPVAVSTPVGGISVFGNYTVQAVLDGSNFTIMASSNALTAQSIYENAGESYIAVQNQVAPYTDIMMTQLSRTDYAGQANKTAPGAPTTLWVNKQIIPQVSFWPVTDNTGPYEAHIWVQRQIQDLNPTGGQTTDLPPAMMYAATLDLARDLSMKFAPAKYDSLMAAATVAWAEAEETNIENVTLSIMPAMPNGLT